MGDLVMPIPNFVADPADGAGRGVTTTRWATRGSAPAARWAPWPPPMAVVANREGRRQGATINPDLLAQVAGRPAGAAASADANNMPAAAGGPGGAGGAAAADFDDLIDLITQTVAPKTWEQNGGQGTIAPFPTNLSLVVSQTQEVHEQIVDLLEQLRRMQDLQVTIEVRFITLSDDFFERIGVDFDFNIRQNMQNPTAARLHGPVADRRWPTANPGCTPPAGPATSVVGLQNTGTNPANSRRRRHLHLRPGHPLHSRAATPWPCRSSAATRGGVRLRGAMGFAIISDIEAFFFINAAQGDTRTNVLQAPKVTLFNGQQAFVSDTSQTPFVISVIPVVADFAAAQQPVIVVLSEGTFMTVQAVVSNDRRFVRLTIVPFFSKIGNVQTFTFQGIADDDHRHHAAGICRPGQEPLQQQPRPADDDQLRRDGAVADLLVRHRDDHRQRARRRHRAAWAASSGSARAARSTACRSSTRSPT